MQRALSVTRQNFPEWYQAVVRDADMAEPSPVRGCMIIKPWGWGIWERIQFLLDSRIKESGHENAYFPLPDSALLHRQGSRARGGLRQGDGGGDAPSPQEHRRQAAARSHGGTGRALHHPPDVGDDHRRFLLALDQEPPRPAAADQPVGKRDALGIAHAPVPAHQRIPLAGGPHRARERGRGDGGDDEDPRALPRLLGGAACPCR